AAAERRLQRRVGQAGRLVLAVEIAGDRIALAAGRRRATPGRAAGRHAQGGLAVLVSHSLPDVVGHDRALSSTRGATAPAPRPSRAGSSNTRSAPPCDSGRGRRGAGDRGDGTGSGRESRARPGSRRPGPRAGPGPGRRTPRAACGWPAPGRRGHGRRAPGAWPAGASSYFRYYRNMKLLSSPSNPLELGDRPLVLDVPGVERAGGLEQQHVDLVAEGPRTVFDAVGHDDQLARADVPIAVSELHAQAPVHDEEQF